MNPQAVELKKYWCEKCQHLHYTDPVMEWMAQKVTRFERNGQVFENESNAFLYYAGIYTRADIPQELIE